MFFVGDVPGTHASIGMGGVSGAVGNQQQQVPQTQPTEQAILYIIKKAIGREISQAQKQIDASPYPLAGNKITGLTVLGGQAGQGKLALDIKLPKVAKTGETFAGVLKTFHEKLTVVLKRVNGVVDGPVQGEIFDLVQDFHDAHGILIQIDFQKS